MEFDVSVELKHPWWIKVKSKYNWGSGTVFWPWKLNHDDLPVNAKCDKQLAENFEQFQERCMSTEYIDEYVVFAVPLADEELEPVLLGKDLELIVRAWNTLSDWPDDFVWFIEKSVLFLLGQKEKSLLTIGSIHVFMFYNKRVLTEAFKEYLKVYMD